MPRLKFNDIPFYNTDQVADALDPDDIFNVYLERSPGLGLVVKRRPALLEFLDTGTGEQGDGIFYWDAKDMVIAVSNGAIFQLFEDGTFATITDATLEKGVPVVFADGSKLDSTPWLYMANGKLVYSEDGGHTQYPTDPDTPTTATQVAYLNLKFVANIPETNHFMFTDVNPDTGFIEPDYWSSPDNPLSADSRGDTLAVVYQFLQELYIWGTQSMEVWYDDGVTPLISIPQAASESGIEAPYSITQVADMVLALVIIDGVRFVVKMTGRTPQVISEPISNVLNGYDTVSDAIGSSINIGGTLLYLLQFPSSGKTWAYDLKNEAWIPWGTWSTITDSMEQFIGLHSCFVKSWNKHLMMSRVDGKVYELSFDSNMDGDSLIKSYRRTIWEDHGNGQRKKASRIRIKVKTGATLTGAMYLRWADDGSEDWSPYMEIELYPIGQRNFMVDIPQMGTYKSRRYEISITDDAELMFCWADEDIIQLRT